jgi:uncharacterized protein YecE (DUF72 family)
MTPPPQLRIGPSGWQYPGWDGVVFPAAASRRLHPLRYLAGHFGVVEIESTARAPLRPEVAHMWLGMVSGQPGFQFTAVLDRRFTHERLMDKAEITRFKAGLAPLVRVGRFGCLVLSFPWAFRFTAENREHVIRLRRAFHEFPMAVEVKHSSWRADEALGTLVDYRLGFVNVDLPPRTSAMPPSAIVTSGVGYVRLHGRDQSYWAREFRPGAAEAGLNDYLYSPAELGEWKARIEKIRAHAREVFVITCNPAGGKSVVNALQLAGLLASMPETERAVA